MAAFAFLQPLPTQDVGVYLSFVCLHRFFLLFGKFAELNVLLLDLGMALGSLLRFRLCGSAPVGGLLRLVGMALGSLLRFRLCDSCGSAPEGGLLGLGHILEVGAHLGFLSRHAKRRLLDNAVLLDFHFLGFSGQAAARGLLR